jgi:hypothetical protein
MESQKFPILLVDAGQYTFPSGKTARLGKYTCCCGNTFVALKSNVNTGNTTSCGCVLQEARRERLTTHGMSKTPLYGVWQTMRNRCKDPKHIQYKDYGGRGITYCARWDIFENFLEDMGIPEKGMQIDRIDNDGPYCKDNCRWATRKENLRHTRKTRSYCYKGTTYTIWELSALFHIPHRELQKRLHRGWDLKRALTQPMRRSPDYVCKEG